LSDANISESLSRTAKTGLIKLMYHRNYINLLQPYSQACVLFLTWQHDWHKLLSILTSSVHV